MANVIMSEQSLNDGINSILFDDFEIGEHIKESSMQKKSDLLPRKSNISTNNYKSSLDNTFSKSLDDIVDTVTEEISQNSEKHNVTYIEIMEEQIIDKNIKELINIDAPVITSLLKSGSVKKVIIQNYKTIFIETDAGQEKVDVSYNNENELKQEINEIKKIHHEVYYETECFGEIILNGGIRFIYVYKPFSATGTQATLIFPSKDYTNKKDFINKEVLNKEMLYLLERCVRGGINIVVSSNNRNERIEFLNLINGFIPEDENVVAIDSRKELLFSHDNVCKLDDNEFNKNIGITATQLATHMQPNRICINELSSKNISEFLYLDNMGCHGNTASIHANSAKNLCNQVIPLMFKTFLNSNKDLEYLPYQINECMQLIVQLSNIPLMGCKVTAISHVDGTTADGNLNIKDIFIWNKQKETFETTGYIPKKLIQIIKMKNLSFNEEIFKKEEQK